jgi:hypothetical protein
VDYKFLRTSRSETAADRGGQPIPPEIRRWNWGAFFLHFLWGMGNNTWIALLVFVPVIGWFMPFVLGAQGSVWAWKNGDWEDVEHFKRVQRRWAVAGLLVWIGVILIAAAPLFTLYTVTANFNTAVRAKVFAAMVDNTEVNAILGTPVVETKDGNARPSSSRLTNDRYELQIPVNGPKGRAIVEARGRKIKDEWTLDGLTLLPPGGGPVIVILPRKRL